MGKAVQPSLAQIERQKLLESDNKKLQNIIENNDKEKQIKNDIINDQKDQIIQLQLENQALCDKVATISHIEPSLNTPISTDHVIPTVAVGNTKNASTEF